MDRFLECEGSGYGLIFIFFNREDEQECRDMLTVKEHLQKDTKVLELSGRFDYHSKLGLEAAILGAKEIGCQHVILNFSNITWIDSVGLGQLFLWYHRMRPGRIRLSIVSPQAPVRELLEYANLPEVVPIFQTEEEALHRFSSPIAFN
ncbi:MAG: STAS domain-containing protein [Nitrospirales bacterium]|nr:STAS domain-containing protein [Nitrospira sp.]MCB9712148.1 STAS domain-containing protein [Nitrospiraceae bacterium]MDR4488087.1 STAS domain-containing protein [Nitrospirales bacterium]